MIGRYNFAEIEPEVLDYWKKNSIYAKAKEKNNGKQKFYFLDGPPYTSGRVHVGTAWNKALKDSFLRYKRMTQRFDVWDRAGYDMHGIPIEHKVQQKLKLPHKEDIEKFGVAKFIEECRKLAIENMHFMNQDFTRLGVWMDFENAYTPIVRSFIDGEWWLIKKAHENNRLYQGKRTMTWCATCATALAKHELEYEEVKDESIFLKFKIKGKKNEYLIIWTTTPWTIPFNMGIMVNPDLEYIKAKVGDEYWFVAKGLQMMISGVANKSYEIVEEMMGQKLEGLAYEHPLHTEIDYEEVRKQCKNPEKMHTVVLSEEYVDLSAGTGLVHMAPGCGPEDYEIGHKNGIYPFNNLDETGIFPKNMGKYSGWTAKTDDHKFIEDFKHKGFLIESTSVEHDYAHCWRCHKPVIYRTTKQWFFKVEDLKEKMVEKNKEINWVPQSAFNAFDSWLRNLRDNSITKQRFWGTPLPVWFCDKCEQYTVVGSLKELEQLSGKLVDKFHKPWIDEITIPCKCGAQQKRIPDILDVWVDAGTTSWNCLDYPEREDLFKQYFPADFILEGKDQIRGWFNLLMVASMISMERPSFKSVYMHGFVQDSMGRKMSKSLGNYILPQEIIDKYGADTLRYYMIGGANPGIDINYNFDDMSLKSRCLGVLWNLHKYLIDYSKETGFNIKDLDVNLVRDNFSLEEKYIMSKMNSCIETATKCFEEYRLNEVPTIIEELFLELSRTYIQLVRDKASTGEDLDKQAVLYTIYEVLINTLKMFSTIAPMISEKCYLNMKEAFDLKEESITHYVWPTSNPKDVDKKLEQTFSIAQSVIQSALSAREKMKLGVRWPLKELVVLTQDDATIESIDELEDNIKTQVNVKEIKAKKSFDKVKETLKADYEKLQPDFKELAPIVIAKLAMASMESVLKKVEEKGSYELDVGTKKVQILKDHIIHERTVEYPYVEAEFRKGYIYLNQERSEELEAEGYAREVMRRVQAARKKAGLQKNERISLFLKVSEDLKEYLDKFEKQIKEKVGATQIRISELDPTKAHSHLFKEKVKDEEFQIMFSKE